MIVYRNGHPRLMCDGCYRLGPGGFSGSIAQALALGWAVDHDGGFSSSVATPTPPQRVVQAATVVQPAQPAHRCSECGRSNGHRRPLPY